MRNKHGKLVYRTVRHKETYTAMVRDDRLKPEKAIPAAALTWREWSSATAAATGRSGPTTAGEGCVADFRAMAQNTPGLDDPPASVARFSSAAARCGIASCARRIHAQMDRDYSPTYWFRVMRAEQLLRMYRDDPVEFRDLAAEYRYAASPAQRAPDRLSAWLKPRDLIYETRAI